MPQLSRAKIAASLPPDARSGGGVIGDTVLETEHAPLRRPALRLTFEAWKHALGSGRFFSRWSALVAIVVGTVFVPPEITDLTAASYVRAMEIALLGMIVLAIPLVVATVIERRLASRKARAIVVLTTIVLAATARPFVNDALSQLLLGETTEGGWGSRIATNIVVGLALFSAVAIATTQARASGDTFFRLDFALDRMELAVQRVTHFAAESHQQLEREIAALRADRDRLLDGPIDFFAVREYSEVVRSASHRLDALAHRADRVGDDATDVLASPVPLRPPALIRRHVALSERLISTPWFAVGAVYAITCFPFVLATGGLSIALAATAFVFAFEALAGMVIRIADHRVPGALRVLFFIATWAVAGTGMALAGNLLLPDLAALALVPLLSLPVTAVILAVTVDGYRRAVAVERTATATLGAGARALGERIHRAVAPIESAVDILHGRVQGRCVILAALADAGAPTPDDTARFRSETDAAFDEIIGPARSAPRDHELDDLLAVWRTVVDITVDISDAARAALAGGELESDVCDIVNEGLVNAVKHSRVDAVGIALDVTDAATLRVRVSSIGVLERTSSAGRGVSALPGEVRLSQVGERVVLEALLATADIAQTTSV